MLAQHSVLIMVALVKELAMTKHYGLNRDTLRYELQYGSKTFGRKTFGKAKNFRLFSIFHVFEGF